MATPPPANNAGPAASGWAGLTAELDAWATAGRQAAFWWRDDDAARVTESLRHLLTLAARANAPLALAAIPAHASVQFADLAIATPGVTAIQHGYAHIDHAPKGAGSWELGIDRPLAEVTAELATGRDRLVELFGDRFVPVMVPPWNRIAAEVTAALPGLGFTALSGYGPRSAPHAAPGLTVVNTHCDPIRWRGGARFAGTASSLSDLIDHLTNRRLGHADTAEPTGLLTHHADMDEQSWAFTEQLLQAINDHPAAAMSAIAGVVP